MKRSVLFLGRLGTVMIFVSIAILLSSGIGPLTVGGTSNIGTIPANSFNILQGPLFTPYTTYNPLLNLSPQNAAKISINSTSSVNAYLMNGDKAVIVNWIRTNHPEQPTNGTNSPNTTILDEFLQTHPNLILWQGQGEKIHLNYVPTEIVNITIIVSNPNGNSANIKYSLDVEYGFASISRMRSVAIWTLPIGVLCALPWTTLKIMQRRNRQPKQ
jgi:hypothetical protein